MSPIRMNSDTAQNPIADLEPRRQSNADPDSGTRPPYKKGFGDNKYDIFSSYYLTVGDYMPLFS